MTTKYYTGDCCEVMERLAKEGVKTNLTVCSPPYQELRNYKNGCVWDMPRTAKALYDITCDGGIVCVNIGDQRKDFDESGFSYKLALEFKKHFKLLQTIIVVKDSIIFGGEQRLANQHEFCFCFLRGEKPRVFNKLMDRPNKQAGKWSNKVIGRHGENDELKKGEGKFLVAPFGARTSVWSVPVGFNKSAKETCAHEHCAVMSQHLALPLIKMFSQPGDVVLDCFGGSGTVPALCGSSFSEGQKRDSVYIDISPSYAKLAKRRVKEAENRAMREASQASKPHSQPAPTEAFPRTPSNQEAKEAARLILSYQEAFQAP
jgi:DNA modification methylase